MRRVCLSILASCVLLVCDFAGAFGIDRYIINNGGPISISLDGFESVVLNKPADNPYIYIGRLSGKCTRVSGFRNWSCENPNANAVGLQDVVLKTSLGGIEISREKVYLLDGEVAVLAMSKLGAGIVKGGYEYKEGNFNEWLQKITFPSDKFLENLRLRSGDEDFRSSETYVPSTFNKAKEYEKYDRYDNFPDICQSGLTYIKVPTPKISDLLYGDMGHTASIGVSPTKEPIVGEFGSLNSYDNRLVADPAGRELNAAVLRSIGLPLNIISDVLEYYGSDAIKDGRRLDQIKNYSSTTIFTLDTSDENGDTFAFRGLIGHGSIVNQIIRSIDKDANIVPINVCRDGRGNCDERLIIDGLCQAILYNAKYSDPSKSPYTKVIVNMSISSSSANKNLRDLINFARRKGVIFVVANGNLDACANYTTDTICHQYPSDWSKEEYNSSHAPMITVGAIDYLKGNSMAGLLLDFDRKNTENTIKVADIYAPGEYYQELAGYSRTQYVRRFGTSFAAPYVTGILSLWLKTFNGPDFLPCEIGKITNSEGVISLSFPSGNLSGNNDGAEYGAGKYEYECIR